VGNLIPGKSANFWEMPQKNQQISGKSAKFWGKSAKFWDSWEKSGNFWEISGKIGKSLGKIGKFPGNRQISGKCLKVSGSSFPGSDLPGYGK
jgi:hypothetical protein